MSEINKLWIENFQSHRKTEIALAPARQLTVIVGPSDSGKTAIIRALKWLLYNRPQGADFIRVGASMARVQVHTSRGAVIRQRSAGVNRYTISRMALGVHGSTDLEGFSNDVPLEVQEITGVRQTMIGDLPLNLNLAEQLDGPFLGSGISDPVRARILGKLAGTEEVDFANKILGTDLYRRNQEKKAAEEDVGRLTEQLKQFEDLPRLQEMVAKLGQLAETVKQDIDRARRLKVIYSELQTRQGQAERWNTVLDKLARVPEAEVLRFQVEERVCNLAYLARTLKAWKDVNVTYDRTAYALELYEEQYDAEVYAYEAGEAFTRLKSLKKILAQLHQAEDAKWAAEDTRDKLARKSGWAEIDVSKGIELADRWRKLWSANKQIATARVGVDVSKGLAEDAENELAQYAGAYQDALLTAGICPTCGNDKIDPEKLKEVV